MYGFVPVNEMMEDIRQDLEDQGCDEMDINHYCDQVKYDLEHSEGDIEVKI